MNEKIIKMRMWFKEKKVLKHFLFYTVMSFVVVIIASPFIPQEKDLELIPVEERIVGDTEIGGEPIKHNPTLTFSIAFLFLPLWVMIEELGFRWAPFYFFKRFKKWFSMKHITIAFLIFATFLDAFAHQSNVISGTLSGKLTYLLIQCTSGFYLAWLLVKKGLKTSWFVHLAFDFLVFGLLLLFITFGV